MFVSVPELIILVPPLLGLKGNLEMTLSSRLSTQVIAQCTLQSSRELKEFMIIETNADDLCDP